MTRISKRIIGWLLGVVAIVAIALGIAFTRPQTKTVSADTVEVTWSSVNFEPNVDGTAYTRIRFNTPAATWSAAANGVTDDCYFMYTKLNGKTIKELNEAASANGSPELIKAYLQNPGSFSFYGIYIPDSFTELSAADIYTVSMDAGWSHTDSAGTGNTFTYNTTTTWYYRGDKTLQQNTGAYKDINASASFTFSRQSTENGSTCYILNTKDTSGLWTAYSWTMKKGDPAYNWIYINGKSVKDWNAEAQAAVDAGEVNNILYGSTHDQNSGAGAPIAVLPGYANNANHGAFFQIYISDGFLSEVYSIEFKPDFVFMPTGTNDLYYMSEGVRFDMLGTDWRQITDFVDLDGGDIVVQDQGTGDYAGVNCFLIKFGADTNIASYMCMNDNYQKASPLTGLTYGENLDYITINGKTLGQIRNENPAYDYSTSNHPNIKNGYPYAPIFAHMSSANLGRGTENYIQVYIPTDLIDPSTVTEIGLDERLFNYNSSTSTKYGLTEDVTFVKKNGSWVDTRDLVSSANTTISTASLDGSQGELYRVDITSSLWNSTCDAYDYNYGGSVALRQNLFINGVSVHTINTTVDDSAYTYSTSPMTNTATWEYEGNMYHLFQNPVMLYGKGDTMTLFIHKTYMDSINGNVTVTVGESFKYLGTTMAGSLSQVVLEKEVVSSYTVTVDGVEQTVAAGGLAIEPETPTKAEDANYTYTFDNWYIVDTDTVFSFSTAINQNYNVESRFTAVPKDTSTTINFNAAVLDKEYHETYGTSIRFNTEGLQWTSSHSWVAAADWASIADYTTINGKTVTEINENVEGQKLTLMMQGAGDFSFLRVYIPADVMAIEDVKSMGILAGWSYDNGTTNYVSTSTHYFYNQSGTMVEKTDYLLASDITISDAYSSGTAGELYMVEITSSAWNSTCDAFDYNYAGYEKNLRRNIYINGVSIQEINSTVDDSAYVYSTSPMTNTATYTSEVDGETYDMFNNPVLFHGSGNKLTLWIHKDYIESLGIGDITVSLGIGFVFVRDSAIVLEDVSATVLTIVKPTEILTTVDDVQFFYMPDNNPFLGIKVEGNDYAAAGNTYSGSSEKNALYYAKSSNFLSHVYIDGVALTASTQPGEAFLNVWNNLGYFTIRKGDTYNNATEITIKAGLELPTYNNLSTGANEVYVITEDATFIKYNGAWVNKAKLAIEETGVLAIEFQNNTNVNGGKDNWLVFALDNHDYGEEAAKTDSALYQVTIAELQRIGFLDNVVLKGEVVVGDEIVTEATLAEIELNRTALIAYWGGGLIGVQLADLVSYDSIETIIIKENCTFPSYQYACLGSEIDTRYVVLSAMEFNFISCTESETTPGAYNSLYGSDSKIGYDISMAEGAAVRLKGNSADTSGIRFQTNISKATLESLQEKLADEVYESVSFGTLIVPTDYLMGGNFTHEWLKNNYGENGYIDIESTAGFENGWPVETNEYVSFFGSIVKLNASNYSRKFSGVGYIKVVKSNGETVYFYATYNSAYSRSAAFIASAAIADRSTTQTNAYPTYIKDNNNYSPYAVSELTFLEGYIDWTETWTETSLEDSGVEGNTFTLNSTGELATVANSRNTETLTVNKSLAGAYVMLNYQTNIDVWGKFYYKSASSTEVAEDFYLQKGTSQHKQFLDLFRKNGVGTLAGITTTDTITLTKIEFRNATVDNTTLSTGTLKVFSLYSSARTIDASKQEIYLTTTDGSITVGAHLGLGGALTYLAKAGLYEGVKGQTEYGSFYQNTLGYTKYKNGTGSIYLQEGINGFNESRGLTTKTSEAGYYGSASSTAESGAVNLINNRDVGRQIQQAWYAAVGGSDTATNGENGYTRIESVTDGDTKLWPYNPVQGGDTDSNPSQIIDYEHNKEKGYIYVKTRAMDWAYQDKTDANGTVTGLTTKSYMENYYRLDNTNNTVVVNNSFIDWNGFTDMDTCDFASNELPATYPIQTLNYFFSYVGSDTSWTEALHSTAELGPWNEDSSNYTQSNDGSLKGKKMENWFAWANDANGSVALGMYIPNVHRFVSGRSHTAVTTATSANVNAKSDNVLYTGNLMSNMQAISYTYQSAYVSNTSYTAPAISYRMEAYVPIEYTYVLCVDSVASMRTKFHAIEQSGKITNAGSKAGEKVGLDAWARQDKLWTQV